MSSGETAGPGKRPVGCALEPVMTLTGLRWRWRTGHVLGRSELRWVYDHGYHLSDITGRP